MLFRSNQDPKLWQVTHVKYLQSIKARIDALDPADRAKRRDNIENSLARTIQNSFNQTARIEAKEESRIRELIEFLRSDSPLRADELQAGLEERLEKPELVFELLKSVLPDDPAYQLDKIACRGNVELIAQFAPNWQTANRLGLMLNATGSQQYEFLVATSSDPNSPAAKRTFKELFDAHRHARILIQRREGDNVVVLRDEEFSLDRIGSNPLRIKATRNGQRLSVWVGDQERVEFDDLFPVNPHDQGVFSLVWQIGRAHVCTPVTS